MYTSNAPRSEWLAQYASVFQTVEVNSTFYALPPLDRVRDWALQTPDTFRFCCKVPRAISHEARLRWAECTTTLSAFIRILDVLANEGRLGPTFLQLPPTFSPAGMPDLKVFFENWPREFPLTVEPRHRAWFDHDRHERAFDDLLRRHELDRCLFDSRALFSAPPTDAAEETSQSRKPRSPHRTTVIGTTPFVRFVARNDLAVCTPWLEEWSAVIADWLTKGYQPYIMTHAPDDRYAPRLARDLWNRIVAHCPAAGSLPAWPGEANRPPRQLRLF